MTMYRAQVAGQLTGATHRWSNSFHFAGAAGTSTVPAEVTEVVARLLAFYTRLGAADGTNGNQVLSSQANAFPEVKVYNMSDPEPRVPVYDDALSFPVGVGKNSLPWEVAYNLSYRRDFASGVPNSRRRGRIYIGPIATTALANQTAFGIPPGTAAGIRTRVLSAGQLLADQIVTPLNWVQYSPTTGQYAPVTYIWTDDTWDTQRARGHERTDITGEPIV